jgi:hypothetical protein
VQTVTNEDRRPIQLGGEPVPMAAAMRTVLMQFEEKAEQIGVGDGVYGGRVVDELLGIIRTWLGLLEQQPGQGEAGYALQLAFDLARQSGNPMRAIVRAADIISHPLDTKMITVDNVGLPTDPAWREQHGIGPAEPR